MCSVPFVKKFCCHISKKNFVVIYLKISNEKMVNEKQAGDKMVLSLGALKCLP